MPFRSKFTLREHRTLGWVLLWGFVVWAAYFSVGSPWGHYDEPGHFEYVWLIANRDHLPAVGEYDQAMRREMAASMVEHGFFETINLRPNLLSQDEPVWIGISQLDDPPVYYWLAALPLRLIRYSDITFQLYAARLTSLVMFLVVLVAAYGIATELTAPGHLLRWLFPLGVAMVPAFVELMTAINNDVGATMFFSLYLWAGVRLLRRGFDLKGAVAVVVLALLCFWTKNTVVIALPLAVIPLLLSALRSKLGRWVLVSAGAVLCLAGMLMLLVPDGVAAWYQNGSTPLLSRIPLKGAPCGTYVFRLTVASGSRNAQLFQPITAIRRLRGKTLTVGAWIWADEPTTAWLPLVDDGVTVHSQQIVANPIRRFYSFRVDVSPGDKPAYLILRSESKTTPVYYDAVTVVEGDFTQAGQPNYEDAEASRGSWGGQPITNLVRNASAESAWLRLRRPVVEAFSQIFPANLSAIVTSLGDWEGSGWYYRSDVELLFRSFWGRFGWGNIQWPGGDLPYVILKLVSGVGIAAALVHLGLRRKDIPWDVVCFLGVAALCVWGAAILRGSSVYTGYRFWPTARYASPAILPTMLMLAWGWFSVAEWLRRQLRMRATLTFLVYAAIFLSYHVLSLGAISAFYR